MCIRTLDTSTHLENTHVAVVQHVVNFVRHTLNGRDAHIFNSLATMQIPHAHDTTPKSATRGQPTRVLKGLLRDFLSETGPCQGVCEGEHGNGEEHAKPKQQAGLPARQVQGVVSQKDAHRTSSPKANLY